MSGDRLDLERPRYKQDHFSGRFWHFFDMANPLNIFATNAELQSAVELLQQYKSGQEPRETTDSQVWHAQKLYNSAFHPDTGEKQTLIGRMSFQVPGGLILVGGMLAFYKSNVQVVMWQFFNQSFNAVVNYTNRNANSPITKKQMAVAYASATTTATITATFLNRMTKAAPPILQRWVPFAAVAAANCVNIPFMRQQELKSGVTVSDEEGNPLGQSKKAAMKGIAQVCISRISMAASAMIPIPVIMRLLERTSSFKLRTRQSWLLQTLLSGIILVVAVPMGCSLFPQTCSMALDDLEADLQDSIRRQYGSRITRVYFNKGL
ncbi:sideroflexin-2-like [Corticium candelabrum]|uniref:sideroflexin-2-like n=1 Tax=Corticium candelabrum TaxID=121492 RepID=UPI002E26F9D6|nr:sideroflexin-2-like [Corticium candelabrum]